ncbi:hypothetical protein FBY06_14043 [Pseudomonas sp. SJZ085]|uniref:hypothetical protein n=1 Tax=unclassified Pseudomonas TaxID=196821 RepID=UPI001199ED94|nr:MULTISPECIES: hypothetical protein [unclassified Pseudomonas]TWC12039.1 hypothetical protein FBX99_13943 [Pseudomonas sp. SJZ074]TWC30620.1 hypothetical protein FBY06_14043 [Pseudomonas sp. SJZ085]
MIGEAIHDDTLKALVSQHAVRDVVVGRLEGDNHRWTLSVRLGAPTARLIPVRSRREPLRIWKSASAVVKYADAIGLRSFTVEL